MKNATIARIVNFVKIATNKGARMKREIEYIYGDRDKMILRQRISKLGNIRHGITIYYYNVKTPYHKILYKFGKKVTELFLFQDSKGNIYRSKTNSFSELVKEGRKNILKQWQATKRGVFLKSEAETKNSVLHGKKVVYNSDGWVSQILQYRDGKLEGTCYSYNKDADIVTEVNYKNDVRHGEAFLIGSSMFCDVSLNQGVRVLTEKSTSNKEFVALYENGAIVELYFSRFGVKIARVHESMIKEVSFSTDLP